VEVSRPSECLANDSRSHNLSITLDQLAVSLIWKKDSCDFRNYQRINDAEQTMIFEKFYRGRNQRISVQGTGMGLAIARAIVELHGGTMGLTSQLGRGSVFYFSLPVNCPPDNAVDRGSQEPRPRAL